MHVDPKKYILEIEALARCEVNLQCAEISVEQARKALSDAADRRREAEDALEKARERFRQARGSREE